MTSNQSFKVVNSSQHYSNIDTSYLTAYNAVLDNLFSTNIGSESILYTPPPSSTIYNVVCYSPTDFVNTATRKAYFLNISPNMPEASLSTDPMVLNLPANAYIIEAVLNITSSILPSQQPYQSIMLGTQPITDTTAEISGNIISGDSNLFISGESYTMSSTPFNRGQYIGGFLTYPLSIGIPVSVLTVGVNFTPSPTFLLVEVFR